MDRPLAVTSDIHSCFPEFVALLEGLGFRALKSGIVAPADKRLLIFAGDLVDRGEWAAMSLLLMQRLVAEGHAMIGALGNHDERLLQSLNGSGFGDRILTSAVDTLRQLLRFPDPALPREAALSLFNKAPRYSIFPDEQLLITHGAAFPRDLTSRADPFASHFTRGVLSHKVDSRGRHPRNYDWVKHWRGHHFRVLFGHHSTPNRLPGIMADGRVIALDTACAMGGNLSAFLYPERRFLIVKSTVKEEGEGPRGIQMPMRSPRPEQMKRARVTAARTKRWSELLLKDTGITYDEIAA